jgi:glucan biosynthesis protein C
MTKRIEAVDAARALFLLLGIPYHFSTLSLFSFATPTSGMAQSPLIGSFMSATHVFRMCGFFVISGFFAAMMIRRRGRPAWLKDRLSRLGFPLIASLLTIGVVQHYVRAFTTGRRLEEAGSIPLTIGHLWFLIVLLAFVLTLNFVRLERVASSPKVAEAIRLRGKPALALIALLAFWGLGRAVMDDGVRRYGAGEIYSLFSHYVLHAPAFAIGACAQFGTLRAQLFTFATKRIAVGATILMIIYVCLDPLARTSLGLPVHKGFFEKLVSNLIELPTGYLASVCLFKVFSKLVTRRYAVVNFFVQGAMAIYLFHIIWAYLVIWALKPTMWPAEVQWMLGSCLVLALSIGCFLLSRSNPWSQAAFCGSPMPPVRSRASLQQPS